jgi:exodeoxyribonuclease VII small subunit
MEQTQTYEEAYKELTEIASEIENDTISVDQLAQKVKKASELIKICQSKLREAETEVNNIITQMDDADENKKK